MLAPANKVIIIKSSHIYTSQIRCKHLQVLISFWSHRIDDSLESPGKHMSPSNAVSPRCPPYAWRGARKSAFFLRFTAPLCPSHSKANFKCFTGLTIRWCDGFGSFSPLFMCYVSRKFHCYSFIMTFRGGEVVPIP